MLRYRPDIDGLRALAVIPVILFHFDIAGFHGGFVGVDVFFVISGYLITALIYKEVLSNSFSFRDFYERRARRLLPAAFLVVFCCCIAGWILFTPDDYKAFGKSLLAVTLISSNILFMQEAGYFDLPSLVKPLLHTWSLAVEEQFYLFFPPLLLLVMWKFKRYLPHLISGLFLISLGISIVSVEYFPSFAFYMLPARAWELLLGAMLALGMFPEIRARWLNRVVGIAGVIMILLAIVFFSEKTVFPGIAALVPCIGAVFIIWSGMQEKNVAGYILSWRPFVFIGLISYSLYLWHWPLRVFSQYYAGRDLYLTEKVFLIFLTVLLSYLTWLLVEQPVRRKRLFPVPKQVFQYTIVAGAAFLFFGHLVDRFKGVPSRLPEPARSYAMSVWEKNPDRQRCHRRNPSLIAQKDFCILGDKKQGAPDFIVWGDSHADMLMPMLKKLAEEKGVYGWYASYSGCKPFLRTGSDKKNKGCYEFNKAMHKVLEETNIKNVILAGYWWPTVKNSLKYGGQNNQSSELKETLRELSDKNVWVFTDVPIQNVSIPSELVRVVQFGGDIEKIGLLSQSQYERQKYIKSYFNAVADRKLNFIDSFEVLCAGRKHCRIAANGRALYRDTHHLTNSGAFFISRAFEPMFDLFKNK